MRRAITLGQRDLADLRRFPADDGDDRIALRSGQRDELAMRTPAASGRLGAYAMKRLAR
jgi:hypothetical protein